MGLATQYFSRGLLLLNVEFTPDFYARLMIGGVIGFAVDPKRGLVITFQKHAICKS